MIAVQLNKILAETVKASIRRYGDELIGIVQYGSSVNQIKSVSDLDLLYVFKGFIKPKSKDFEFLDENAEPLLRSLAKEGFVYHLSINPILESDLNPSRSFFFDLTWRSKILHDPTHRLAEFLSEVHTYISDHRLERVQQGSHWYWRPAKIGRTGGI